MEPISASSGNLLEMQILRRDLPLTDPEMLGLGPCSLCSHKPSGGSEAGLSVRSTSCRSVPGKRTRSLDLILGLIVEQPCDRVGVEGAQSMNFSDPPFSPVRIAGRTG